MLNKKDQRIIRQMIRHIRTFPLSDSEIKQLERDLTGMALEAEKRGEDFEDVLDMTPTEFCDELLYSIGGSKAPGGRYLLKGCRNLLSINRNSWNSTFFSLILLLALLLYNYNSVRTCTNRITCIICCSNWSYFHFCYLYHLEISLNAIVAQPKSLHSLLIMERILLVTAVIFDIVATLYMIFNVGASVGHFNYKLPLLMQVIIVFFLLYAGNSVHYRCKEESATRVCF
mgnify:CR=1 FL=1